MSNKSTIGHLKESIQSELTPLITADYVLWDLPYYSNIGDLLIWQGELDFLKSIPHKNIDSASKDTCIFPPLKSTDIILLQGGGNFGDLYSAHNIFRNKVIERYPDNRIIMFPQSVWYNNQESIHKDAEIINRHKDLYLCARDRYSYDFMKCHFFNANILLIPDMAFYIDNDILNKYRGIGTQKTLYFKRTDKEFDTASRQSPSNVDIHDWPTFEHDTLSIKFLWKILGISNRLKNVHILHRAILKIIDVYAYNHILPSFTAKGYSLISGYGHVITTRLHAMILSILLNKNISYIDNTTGKLSAFVETWLKDLQSLKQYYPQ